MKNSKKSLYVILTLTIILVGIFILKSRLALNGDIVENKNVEDESIYDLPEISKEEYLKRLAAGENITVEEAHIKDKKHSEEYLKNLAERILNPDINEGNKEFESLQNKFLNRNISVENIEKELALSGNFSYYDLKEEKTYIGNSKFSASVNATLKIYTSDNFGEVNEVLGDVWSKGESGIYNYNWIATNQWHDPSELPTNKITIGCSGYFEIETDLSISGEVELSGFSTSLKEASTQILKSDAMRITRSFATSD